MKNSKYLFINKLKLISSIIKKLSFPNVVQKKFNIFRHNMIKKTLKPYFNNVYSNINNDLNLSEQIKSNIIWIFWWQGNDEMPLIVKKCINSIIQHSSNYKVILVTKYNIKKYSLIPQYIYNKMNNGKISLTHFSDILRFNLLRNHGGLWIDSTILCTSNLSNDYFNNFYTSGGYENHNYYFVSSKWTGFLIGGCKENKIFVFMDEFFKNYWKNNDYLLDYFLIDYALNFVYVKNVGSFKYYVDNYAYKNNPHLHSLMKCLNDKFDLNKYKNMTNDTNLFKLTYKRKFNKKAGTFYEKLINEPMYIDQTKNY